MTTRLLLLLVALGLPLLAGCQQACRLGSCVDCESCCWPEPRLGPVCQSLCAPYVPIDETRACSRVPPSPYEGVPLPSRIAEPTARSPQGAADPAR